MNLAEFLLRDSSPQRGSYSLKWFDIPAEKWLKGASTTNSGGCHRYSTDAHWLVPHFEKMLYDNALVSRLYLHYYQVAGEDFARRIVEETLDYVMREMTSPLGGFYSTQDADSEGDEGKFFVWSVKEITEALGKEDATVLPYCNVTPSQALS
jgi:uncharacterized protein YyaL (SSP411 family)